jgi:hypothetical protein
MNVHRAVLFGYRTANASSCFHLVSVMPNNLHLVDTSIVRPDDRKPERLIATESIYGLQNLARIKGKTSERAIAAC